jgi:hypothetical protein
LDADLHARLGKVKASQEGQEGALTAAAGAYQGNPLTSPDGEAEIVQALSVLAGVVGRPVGKVQPPDIDRSPVLRQSVGSVGAMLPGIGLADEVGRLNVGIVLNDVGVLPGDILEYAGELVDIAQQGDQPADEEYLAGCPMLVYIAEGDESG